MPDGASIFDTIKQTLSDRIHLLPPFRRRVVNVPFQLSHPVWIEDPNFDLDAHIRRIVTPAPGSLRELAEVVGDISSRPLDRSRPLWEMWWSRDSRMVTSR